MDLGSGLGHLTYSTLVHPGDDWAQMSASMKNYLPQVKARVCPDKPFGVSLRLSASSADTLVKDHAAREDLKNFLARNGMYLYTVNAFPYGAFKGTTVKEQVYEPDWRSDARARYTMNVADILADVAPADVNPSIQTPPLGFKPRVTGPEVVAEFARQLVGVTAHLIALERKTGKTVTLAIEPEPYCYLETTDETIAFFKDHMYAGATVAALAKQSGLPIAEANAALRRHVGTVFDICHQAVEYEDIPEALQKLVDAGVPVFKLQEAAAMRVPAVTQETVDILKGYSKTIYLTQTIEKKNGKITRFLNLEDAFKAWQTDPGPREWRIHFHVPVFLDDLGAFKTTRFAIEDALKFHKRMPMSRQLEIETYTWDVLPDNLKTGDIVDYVCREIEWVKSQLV